MTTIGQNLTNPENGWIRVDNVDESFTYIGSWGIDTPADDWNKTQHYTKLNDAASVGSYVEFTTRRSWRFIGPKTANCSTSVSVYIDGVLAGTFNQYNAAVRRRVMIFEYLNTDNKEKVVRIVNNTTKYLAVDAIDFQEQFLLQNNNAIYTISEGKIQKISENASDNEMSSLFGLGFATLTKENCELIAQELGKCKILRAKI